MHNEDGGVEYTFLASPNMTQGRPSPPTMVIIHDCEGLYQPSIDWLRNPASQASAHYVISATGDVTKLVREADTAWHAGSLVYNQRSIGIEHEGYLAQPLRWYTTPMYQTSARLVAEVCHRYNIPIDRQHIIGHNEVRNADGSYGGLNHHTDPGAGWAWAAYLAAVKLAYQLRYGV